MFEREYQVSFTGPLSKQCEQFVGQKQALGLKYKTEAYIMSCFDRFLLDNESPENCLLRELAIEFAAKKDDESNKSFSNRASLIRQFGKFMANMGYESYVLPPFRIVKSTFVPYIYSHNEISLIFAELDSLKPISINKIVHKIYPVLFRMLYCCGLRINEALKLKVCDVDLDKGVFVIKNAKWNSERIVPMSGTLKVLCRKYFNEVHSSGRHTYFFPAKDEGFIDSGHLSVWFKRILRACGISEKARIHDFRHTFAVHLLNRWAKEGKDIYVCLPILSKYMGHASIAGTEQYLRLTAEVHPEVTHIFEENFGGVIPEVNVF